MYKLFSTPSSWVHRLVIDFFAFQLLVYAPDFLQDGLVLITKEGGFPMTTWPIILILRNNFCFVGLFDNSCLSYVQIFCYISINKTKIRDLSQ